jgi:hypothetical protein
LNDQCKINRRKGDNRTEVFFSLLFISFFFSPTSPMGLQHHPPLVSKDDVLTDKYELEKISTGWFISADTVVYISFDQFFCQPLILHHCKLH